MLEPDWESDDTVAVALAVQRARTAAEQHRVEDPPGWWFGFIVFLGFFWITTVWLAYGFGHDDGWRGALAKCALGRF